MVQAGRRQSPRAHPLSHNLNGKATEFRFLFAIVRLSSRIMFAHEPKATEGAAASRRRCAGGVGFAVPTAYNVIHDSVTARGKLDPWVPYSESRPTGIGASLRHLAIA